MWCAHRFVGAALSTVDMVTDVQVIVEYLNTPGKEAYAYPLMGMVGTCLFLQLLVVVAQTRKASKAKMATELLIVLSGLKPGFDAYQVAKGAEQSRLRCLCALLGQARPGQGRAGQGRVGQGRAGQGGAGQGRETHAHVGAHARTCISAQIIHARHRDMG